MGLTINSAQYNSGADYDTVTGEIVSISNAKPYVRMKQVVCDINPVQDLHGYDNPWPAGGGKNLINEDSVFSAATKQADGSFKYTAPLSAYGTIDVYTNDGTQGQFAITYIYKGESSSTVGYVVSVTYTDNSVEYVIPTASTSFVTKQVLTNALKTVSKIRLTAQTSTTTYCNILVSKSTTVLPYSPYSNICPISGWSSAKVTRCGVNQWDEETLSGYYSSGTGAYIYNARQLCSKNFIPVKPNTQYLYQKSVNLGDILFYNAHMEFISAQINKPANAVFTTPENAYYLQINLGSVYGAAYNNDVGINYPSSDTAYHPYNGQTFTISLGDTRYGAVLDVTRGKLRVTWAIDNLGNMTWSYNTPYKMFYRSLTNASFNENHILTSQYGLFTSFADLIADVTKDGAYKSLDNNHSLYIRDTRYSDPAVFKSAMDGVQIAYELGTPVEVDLTPTEITTLLGTNNVWADCGDIEVEYCADTKLWILKKIAEALA